MAILSKLIEGLTNDVEHFVRVYPINPEGFAQSELDGQVASAIPKASRLPDGYTELEYIQSSGTQYIDTGVRANANTAIHFKFSALVLPKSGDFALLGSAWGRFSLLYSSASAVIWYSSGSATVSISTSSVNEIVLTATSIKANGSTTNVPALSSYPTTNIYLLNTGDNGAGTNWRGQCKIHSLQIYDGDSLVRDLVPVRNVSGAVGLFDLVNKMFYSNAGTGAFTAGSEVA